MREIKFRARHLKNKQWYFGVETDTEADPLLPLGIFWLWVENGILDRDTLGEYTSLKDKNGKEIYEGDIVAIEKWKNHLKQWVVTDRLPVVFYGGRFIAEKRNKAGMTMKLEEINILPDQIEVIGNLYENPKLREVQYAGSQGQANLD